MDERKPLSHDVKLFSKTGDFTLRSGRKSNLYVDVKSLILSKHNDLLLKCVYLASKQLLGPSYDMYTAGYGYGGALLASALAGKYNIPAAIIRDTKKSHGLKNAVMGDHGRTCVLLEDVITTGSSVFEALDVARDYEIDIVGLVVVVDRTTKEDFREIKKAFNKKVCYLLRESDLI